MHLKDILKRFKRIKDEDKSCGNCVNCIRYTTTDGQEEWICEEYGFYYVGQPVHCKPPNDEHCTLWTNNPRKKNTWHRYVKGAKERGWN